MNDTYVYKNTGKQPLTFVNVGVVKPGETVNLPIELNHPDMKLVTITKDSDDGTTSSAPTADNEKKPKESAA